MLNEKLMDNEFNTKDDFVSAFQELIRPLKKHISEDKAGHFDLGSSGSVYDKKTQEVEAFLRPLWGLGPLVTSVNEPMLQDYLNGIAAGTDPKSPDYWGDVSDFDQLIVEMASLSTMILLNPDKVWKKFTKRQQDNIHDWLIKVNDCQIPRNNWHFFRVLVNLAMKNCGQGYSAEMMEQDLQILDSFYLENGWYFDGQIVQEDYYISFAFHYYSLVYCHFMEKEDTKRVKIMKQRAIEVASSFKYWFDAKGRALPFGRSLSYRFAQCSFWSALVFANVEALPWGEIKGIIQRNMHHWFNQEIFNQSGVLSIGYSYENLVFAEGYNAPGSPYWSCKTFLLLAVPEDHPFWRAEALPLQIKHKQLASPESKNFYQFNHDFSNLQAFPAGQFINNQSHASSKYSKFVYSTNFGFSVPKSNYLYYEGGFDNCLALAEDDKYFRIKDLDSKYFIQEDRVIHYWNPWQDVEIKSSIIPLENCHLRIHEIVTGRSIMAYEGGFSVPIGMSQSVQNKKAVANSEIGQSTVENVLGFEEAGIVRCEPNTNILYQLTVLPYIKASLAPGKHTLVSLVSGTKPKESVVEPLVKINGKTIQVIQGNKQVDVELEF